MGEGYGEGARGPVDIRSEFRDHSKEMQSYTILYLTREQCVTVDLVFTFTWKENAADIQWCSARYSGSGISVFQDSVCFVFTRAKPESLFSAALHKSVTLLRHLEGSHKYDHPEEERCC